MNKRSFFKSLAIIGAATVAPGIFIPKFEPVRWKVVRPVQVILNPEWVKARYQYQFLFHRSICETMRIVEIAKPRIGGSWSWMERHGYPIRGNEIKCGQIVPIFPYVEV